MSRTIHCEHLDHKFVLNKSPRRIISLVSSATEALDTAAWLQKKLLRTQKS